MLRIIQHRNHHHHHHRSSPVNQTEITIYTLKMQNIYQTAVRYGITIHYGCINRFDASTGMQLFIQRHRGDLLSMLAMHIYIYIYDYR